MEKLNAKPTILIVDDLPDNVALLNSVLKGRYFVKAALNGDDAIAVAGGEHRPDLILLDVMMPGKDGYEVLRMLRDNPRTADIPVIFLTAKSDAMDERKGLELGAVDYIAKPIDPPVVLDRIAAHLRSEKAGD